MAIQLTKPKVLFKTPTWHIVEYEPQKRSIICGFKKYYLSFPYMQFGFTKSKDRNQLHVTISKEPSKFSSYFENTYKLSLPNINHSGEVCLGDGYVGNLEEAVSKFWNTRFDSCNRAPKIKFKKHHSIYQHGHVKIRGLECWLEDNQFHRLEGPAFINKESTEWYKFGKVHREDGPAVVVNLGYLREGGDNIWKEWRFEGQLHRLDGPARIYADGTKEWHLDGQLHRKGDQPAVIQSFDGRLIKKWYKDGKMHRVGSPAYIDDVTDTKYWYYKGSKVSPEDERICQSK